MNKTANLSFLCKSFCIGIGVLYQTGCSSLAEHIQISSSVQTVERLQLPEKANILFSNPHIQKDENFYGILKEFQRPDYRFYDLHMNDFSISKRENFLSQPFNNAFPNLNINEYFKEITGKKEFADIENALPLSADVKLTSAYVDKRNSSLPDALFTWNLKLYFEDSNQKKQLIGERTFHLSTRSTTLTLNKNPIPPAYFSGKTFETKIDYGFYDRDSPHHTLKQNIYNDALKYSILHSSLDIVNQNASLLFSQIKQRNEAINADKIDRHWAIVIGVSNYKYNSGGLSNLTYADNDATAVAEIFHNKLNWPKSRICLLANENATKSQIMRSLETTVRKMGERDMLTVYWSGHGFVNSSETYFACYDTKIENVSTAISMKHLREFLEDRKINNVFFIADTCHAGAVATGTRGLNISAMSNSFSPVRQNKQNQGWIYMLAAESDRQAVEDKQWGHGAFTYFFLKALAGEADGFEGSGKCDQIITPAELRAFLRYKVPVETQKSLGTAVHPLIHTNSANATIWDINIYEE